MFSPEQVSNHKGALVLTLASVAGFVVTKRASSGHAHSELHNKTAKAALALETAAGLTAAASIVAPERYSKALRTSSDIFLTLTAGCFVLVALTDRPLRDFIASNKQPGDVKELGLSLVRTFRRNTNL